MQQMELRESLAEARNAADPLGEVAELMTRISQSIHDLVGRLALLFETVSEENLAEARECVRKMQFLSKLRSEAEALEAELEDTL